MPRNGVSTASSGRVAHLDRVPASETGTLQAAARHRTSEKKSRRHSPSGETTGRIPELRDCPDDPLSPQAELDAHRLFIRRLNVADARAAISAAEERRIRLLARRLVAGAISLADAESQAVRR